MAKFSVRYDVQGSVTDIIEADNIDEARAIANAKAEDENTEFDLDTIDDVNVRVSEMYPVVRNGRKIWTTYIMKTDESDV